MMIQWEVKSYGHKASKSHKGDFNIQFDEFDNSWCLFLNKKPIGYYSTLEDAKEGAQKDNDLTEFKILINKIKRIYRFAKEEFNK